MVEEKKIEPQIKGKGTEKFLEDETKKRKEMDDKIMSDLREENSKLKSSLYFNDHLKRIDNMARQVSLKF